MIVGLNAKDILLYLLFVYGKFGVLIEKIMILSLFTIPLNIPLEVIPLNIPFEVVSFSFRFFFSFFFVGNPEQR